MIEKPQFTRDDVDILRREELYKRFFRVEKVFASFSCAVKRSVWCFMIPPVI